MNIQIFGKSKCFDTKKAERWFKERRIKFQSMDDKVAKEDKVFDAPTLMRTPIVRNGKQATVGFRPEIWEKWE